MLQHFGKSTVIDLADLTEDRRTAEDQSECLAPVVSLDSYYKMVQRGKIKVLRQGKGKGNSALIDYDSLPRELRDKVDKRIGSDAVHVAVLRKWFSDHYQRDRQAQEYYPKRLRELNLTLSLERIAQLTEEYIVNASVLQSVRSLQADIRLLKRVMGGSKKVRWEQLASAINYYRQEVGHTLPQSAPRFRKALREFEQKGYESLISKKFGNQQTRKVDHDTLRLLLAIHRALDLGAQVINISVVSCVPGALRTHPDGAKLRQGLDAALRRAEEQRTVVVAATGNIGTNCEPDSIVYPAHSSTVLAVSAQDEPHTIATYSIPPSGVLLSAPGTTPVGLSPDVGEPPASVFAAGMVTEQGPSSFTGTSFAAPIVSGTAALLKERYPDDTALQIRARIIESADPGTGAVSPYRALTQVPAKYSTITHRQQAVEPVATNDDIMRRCGIAVVVIVMVLLGWVIVARVKSLQAVPDAREC